MTVFVRLPATVCSIFFALASMAHAAMPADAPDARDHVLLSRYAGSWLVGQEVKGFDQVGLPSGSQNGEVTKVEGRVTRLFYLAPAGRSVLEVQRNYEQALERAGAARRDGCADDCGARDFGRLRQQPANPSLPKGQLEGWNPITLLQQWQEPGSERYWYGTMNGAGGTVHIAVLSAKPGTFALSGKHVATVVEIVEARAMEADKVLVDAGALTKGLQAEGKVALSGKHVATVVEIVEARAMEADKVLVDAGALTKGLQAEGKVALYGLYFDTGKSTIKPESKAQLDQMAKLLQSDASLKVHIVGHTDNQGTLDANLVLSKARAQTVVDALTTTYKVDARRLSAAGVASYAPLGSNATETGRARNRRVEMVLQ